MNTDSALLSFEEQRLLLQVSRATIESLLGKYPHDLVSLETGPDLKAGVFVSLHHTGKLRGCIGTFSSDVPVLLQVKEMSRAAAMKDPRFPPLSLRELEGLSIEISVLSHPEVVKDFSKIIIGTHGLVVSRGYRKGVLLPQVATQHNWDRETFLDQTCVKAGLPPNSWRDAGTVVEMFSALVFS